MRHLLKKKHSDIQVLSAGTNAMAGFGPTLETIEVMRRQGIDVSKHVAQPVTEHLIHHADLILCMEEIHRDDLLSRLPEAKGKVHLLRRFAKDSPEGNPNINIPDPIGRPGEVYETCFLMIREAVERVVKEVTG